MVDQISCGFVFKTVNEGYSLVSLGNLFQYSITLLINVLFLMSSLQIIPYAFTII